MMIVSADFLRLFFAFTLVASVNAKPNSCKTHYFNQKIDWDRKTPNFVNAQPFQIPGVIVSGQPNITFKEILNFTGLLWNADTFQELSGLVCTHYGPDIYAATHDRNFVEACDKIVTSLSQQEKSDTYKDCIAKVSSSETQGVSSLVTDIERNLQIYDRGCQATNYSNQVVFNTTTVQCELQTFAESHTTDTIELVSRLFFSILDWLGPSPFSGDVFGACSGLRLLVGMQIDRIAHQLKLIASYVVADGLKRLNNYNSCYVMDENTLQVVNFLLFPDQNEDGLCELLEGSQSDEDYQKLADDILNNLPLVLTNEDQCGSALALLAKMLDPTEIHHVILGIAGFNISNSNDRRTFCADVATSLSSEGMYSPSPYTPTSIDSAWQPLTEQGELLPGFTIMDAFDVIGAFVRSDTLADGAAVLCTVFGPFASQLIQSGNVSQLCDALHDTNTAAVEQICREILVPLQYPPTHPTSFRVPTKTYMLVTGVDMFRRLFKLEALSPELGCSALDDFFHNTDNTLQSAVRFSLKAYFAELLPIARDFCENYNLHMQYLKLNSNMSSRYFVDLSDTISGCISTHLGFDDESEICAKISNGIKEDSGRASDVLISSFSEAALKFLTTEERCIESLDAGEQCLAFALGEGFDISAILYTVTGYKTTEKLCKDVVSSFQNELCPENSGCAQRYNQLFFLTLVILLLSSAVVF